MAGKQQYNQTCPTASALDIVGSRWALLVIRELGLGPRRFGDIHAYLETASTDMVTTRLRELDAAGLIERTDDRCYQLTATGLALGPVLRAMVVWSIRSGTMDKTSADGSPRSPGPDPLRRIVALLSLFARTTDIDAEESEIALSVGHLHAGIRPGLVGYRITEGTPDDPAGTITLSQGALVGMVFDGASVDSLLESGAADVDTAPAQKVLNDLVEILTAVQIELAQPIA